MQTGGKTLSAGGGASLCCLLLLWLIYSHLLREGKDAYSCLLLCHAAAAAALWTLRAYWDAATHSVVRSFDPE